MLWIVLGAYTLLLIAIAIRSRKHSSADEFLMSNRSANSVQVAAGLFTLIGGGELVALASLGFLFGWSGIALFVGYAAGFVFLGVMAPKIRAESHEHHFVSLPDYVHFHFGLGPGLLTYVFSFLAFFALLMLQFSAAGAVVSPFLGVPESFVVVGVGIAVLVYLLVGGFRAVLITDVVQGVAMFVILPTLVYLVANSDPMKIEYSGAEGSLPAALWSSLVFSGFFVAAASADVWQRAYAAKTHRTAKLGFFIGGVSFLVFGFVIVAIGMIARSLGVAGPDLAFVEVLVNHLPDSVSALVALLVLCAMMSTADTETFLLTGLTQHELRRLVPNSSISYWVDSVTGVRVLMATIALASMGFAYFFNNLVGIYTWLLSALVVVSPIVLFSLFRKASDVGMFVAMLANSILFVALLIADVITLDNLYLIALPGAVFYIFALILKPRHTGA